MIKDYITGDSYGSNRFYLSSYKLDGSKSIASLNTGTGELTAKKNGTVTVYAVYGQGKNARKVPVKVKVKISSSLQRPIRTTRRRATSVPFDMNTINHFRSAIKLRGICLSYTVKIVAVFKPSQNVILKYRQLVLRIPVVSFRPALLIP